jgi:hypothetical protein
VLREEEESSVGLVRGGDRLAGSMVAATHGWADVDRR